MADIGGGVLLEATTIGSGTGNYDSFLRIQATSVEEGFNTDQNGNVLDNKASFTHSLQFGDLQPINVGGTDYIEFRLDLNESNNTTNGEISLTDLRIYISGADATLADYNAGFAGFTSIFDLATTQALIDANHGSGTDDYRVLIPVTAFTDAGVTADSYVTLYSSFSGSNGGFEEWRTTTLSGGAEDQPAIAIDKITIDGAASGDGLVVLVDEPISWQYTVTNTGNTALSNIVVTDDQGVIVSPELSGGFNVGDLNHDNKLDTDETWIFTATGTAVKGDYSNIGSVSGEGGGTTVNDSDGSSYFGADPKIDIDKVTVDGATSGDGLTILAGESISWKYTVTNLGNVALSGINVTDDQGVVVTPDLVGGFNVGDANQDGKLDLTETWIYTGTGVAGIGSYSNIGTASGSFTDDAGHTANPSDTDPSSYFGADPQIKIDKVTVDDTASGDGISILSGEPISWKYTVTNLGNVALSGINVTDDQGVVVSPDLVGGFNVGDTNQDGKLDLTEAWVYTGTGVAGIGDYSNIGTASGSFTDDAGHTATPQDTDPSSYFGADPHITLDKKTNGVDHGLNIFQGQPVTWTYDVKNDGNVALSNVVVTDDNGTPGIGDDFHPAAILSGGFNSGDANQNGLLDVGETWHYQATGTAQLGGYVNNATATTDAYTDTAGHSRTPSATDSSDYEGYSNKALTQGFWGSHTDAWDNIPGNEGNPTKSAVKSGVLSSLDVNPSVDDPATVGVDESKYLLLGDANHNGLVDDDHNLWISISLAKSIESSSTSGDARVIMLQQAIAAQLNIDNGVAQPFNLIDEAVMWLKGQGAWASLGVNLDSNNDGFIDTNGAGTALAGPAVKTSSIAWNKYVDVIDPASGIADWNGGQEANGEGLKNALMWFNQDQLVTSGPGGNVGWFNGTTIIDEHPNTLDQFWLTLHEVGGLTGIK
ncbi:MAG: hypothetical protein EOS54_24200 [Mesorhizobium sp.]|uniref:DUF7507 domain-containing protein n=1 Tax=unclassified Mesorhizobium TaxID=325217 RepID=UPI000F75D223|nr:MULTISPECIES: hypothetical protein [unclassified Mesorhizobium]AZO47943.1 hypothetical protein EJ073_09015 [Mesorhizobium sp. M4B.F.Ca.ET.058.02.1.1]RVC41435.1 hypothetical protein EN781_26075 [Mesorhizobium sp. M4A.F.Ca.ET.090.04.2.1]RVC77387.1 hypothetical protein EN745_22005 [Mesorhizobium sp. M4A.F.Ca.ET.022.05.2.1]RWC47546.1 MAG: hypothetical protein EOS54_24200 [Mesorhizobium sp.]RWD12201.1 MAG: hypothetical protein EOS74_24200 [Mesorhizobium sp.]